MDYLAYKVNSFFNLANLQIIFPFNYINIYLVSQQNNRIISQEFKSLKLYQVLNILSIDIVIGSLLSGAFVVRILNVFPGWAWWVILPLSVWVIYTLDHLLDACKLEDNSHSLRHRYHLVHMKLLIRFLVLVVLTIFVIVVFFLKRDIIVFGLFAIVISCVYLIGVYFIKDPKSNLLQKEIFVALIYTAGIWGGPILLLNNFQLSEVLLMLVFFFTVLIDILLFAVYEIKSDKLDNHNTFPIKYGQSLTVWVVYILSLCSYLICIYEIIVLPYGVLSIAYKIIMIMIFILLLSLSFSSYLRHKNYYRFIGELVFWIPGIILLT